MSETTGNAFVLFYVTSTEFDLQCKWFSTVKENAKTPWLRNKSRKPFDLKACTCPLHVYFAKGQLALRCVDNCPYKRKQPKADLKLVKEFVRQFDKDGYLYITRQQVDFIVNKLVVKNELYFFVLLQYFGYEKVNNKALLASKEHDKQKKMLQHPKLYAMFSKEAVRLQSRYLNSNAADEDYVEELENGLKKKKARRGKNNA